MTYTVATAGLRSPYSEVFDVVIEITTVKSE